jgi:lipoprotein-releasing system permease protein
VSEVSPVYVQEVVLRFKQQNKLISLLGVDDRFIDVFAITDQIPVGRWVSSTDDEILLGYGTAIDLGAGLYDYDGFVECMIPKSGVLNPLDPNPFHSRWATNVGLFQISEEIDYNYAFAPIRFVRALTKKDGDIYTELNVKISYGSDNKAIKKEVASLLGDSFLVVEKEALNPALYRMLQTERVAIYLILTLVLIIALFNVVGAVVMMVLDKRDELKTLHGIGMSFSALRKVFFFQGLLISGVGGLIGLFVGVVVVLAQSWGSFVLVPGTQLPYPVVFEFLNVGALLLIWSSLSVLAAWIASAVVRPRLFS